MPINALKHGHSADGKVSPTYASWANMIQRCENPKHTDFKNYGARGIAVCARWHRFEDFLEDMGERPEGTSIDREDSSKGYDKDNCKWADRIEQARGRRGRYLTFKGETLWLSEWARRAGIKRETLQRRLDAYGWSVEKALTTGGHFADHN